MSQEDSYLLGNKLWDKKFAKHITSELWHIRLKKTTLFKKTKVKDSCSANFATCNDWKLPSCTCIKKLCGRKNLSKRDVENHLSAKPAANGGVSLKGIRKHSSKRIGYFQASVETSSNLCCSIYALSTIASWVVWNSLLDDISKVHPLLNLSEISFRHLYCALKAWSQLHYHSIKASDNFAGTNLNTLNLFCNCAPGACYVLLNVNPSAGNSALHVVAVHVLKQWTKV